ncbi:MAG: tail protein X [Oscillospiraceae bacterium]|nr:tail protein X [Oscillospiraceae bacterium]
MGTYRTAAGDMWDSVAYEQLGSTGYTDALMRANTDCLGYYIFPAGVTLTLPTVSAADVTSLPPWKQASG